MRTNVDFNVGRTNVQLKCFDSKQVAVPRLLIYS